MFSLLALFAFAAPVFSAVTPTSPSSATVVRTGQDLTALWTADSTGQWTDLEIQLMTGDNLQMVPLAVLASGVDGTKTISFSTPAPAVSPNSQIYFLQFTRAGDLTTATWTTRFTIADASGATTQPTNSTVYNGVSVNWGTGVLLDPSALNSTSTGSNSNSNSTVPVSSASSASRAAVSTLSASSTSPSTTRASTSSSSSGVGAVAASLSSSGSTRVASASASATSKAAAKKEYGVGLGGVVVAAIGAWAWM